MLISKERTLNACDFALRFLARSRTRTNSLEHKNEGSKTERFTNLQVATWKFPRVHMVPLGPCKAAIKTYERFKMLSSKGGKFNHLTVGYPSGNSAEHVCVEEKLHPLWMLLLLPEGFLEKEKVKDG